MQLEEQLYQKIKSLQYFELPPEVIDKVKTIALHNVALGTMNGQNDWTTKILHNELMVEPSHTGGYSLLGHLKKTQSAEDAIQHNATAIASSVLEDYLGPLHMGPIITSVIMQELENQNLKGQAKWEKWMESLVAALEVGCWMSELFGEEIAGNRLRSTPLLGAIAAIAAIAKLKGFDKDTFVAAIAYPVSTGLATSFPLLEGTEEWMYQAGFAAVLAYRSCRLAENTSFSHQECISGMGSLATLLHLDQDVLERRVEKTNCSQFRLFGIGLKRHPVNIFVQPAVEAGLRMREQNEVLFSEETLQLINHVIVEVPKNYENMKFLAQQGPFKRPYQAVLSIPACIALVFQKGNFSLTDLQQVKTERVLELASKVQLRFSEQLKDYDSKIMVSINNKELALEVSSNLFYPNLEEEINWLKKSYSNLLQQHDDLQEMLQFCS